MREEETVGWRHEREDSGVVAKLCEVAVEWAWQGTPPHAGVGRG